ncbi:hypothetical protein BURMUCF2_3434 [Burkholderia multivorans CF2]|nr:hypothetical protein BURMUCF2_3434 [Burkholderia multivorans CF2]
MEWITRWIAVPCAIAGARRSMAARDVPRARRIGRTMKKRSYPVIFHSAKGIT